MTGATSSIMSRSRPGSTRFAEDDFIAKGDPISRGYDIQRMVLIRASSGQKELVIAKRQTRSVGVVFVQGDRIQSRKSRWIGCASYIDVVDSIGSCPGNCQHISVRIDMNECWGAYGAFR